MKVNPANPLATLIRELPAEVSDVLDLVNEFKRQQSVIDKMIEDARAQKARIASVTEDFRRDPSPKNFQEMNRVNREAISPEVASVALNGLQNRWLFEESARFKKLRPALTAALEAILILLEERRAELVSKEIAMAGEMGVQYSPGASIHVASVIQIVARFLECLPSTRATGDLRDGIDFVVDLAGGDSTPDRAWKANLPAYAQIARAAVESEQARELATA